MRASGKSIRQIAVELNVSIASVSTWTRDVDRPAPDEVRAEPEPPADLTPFRTCSRCGETLPASAFNRRANDRQWWCRECFRAYFRARGERHLAQVKTAKRRRRDEAHSLVQRYLESHSCTDCGLADPDVLEFDHLRDKRAAVSWLRATATAGPAILEEISKCEVVCTNCHRRRTARRSGWWRTNPNAPPPPTLLPNEVRNLRHIFAVLQATGCVDCDERDLVVLDFDHVGEKTGNVTHLARRGASLARLKAEIGQCEVRCANCHRRRTRRTASRAA